MKKDKSQTDIFNIINSRIEALEKWSNKLKDKTSFQGTESMRLEALNNASAEIRTLESTLDALCDGRDTETILETNFCKGV
jgi:hypothetical protein